MKYNAYTNYYKASIKLHNTKVYTIPQHKQPFPV